MGNLNPWISFNDKFPVNGRKIDIWAEKDWASGVKANGVRVCDCKMVKRIPHAFNPYRIVESATHWMPSQEGPTG